MVSLDCLRRAATGYRRDAATTRDKHLAAQFTVLANRCQQVINDLESRLIDGDAEQAETRKVAISAPSKFAD